MPAGDKNSLSFAINACGDKIGSPAKRCGVKFTQNQKHKFISAGNPVMYCILG